MLISRDWNILRTNGHLRWTRLKEYYKISISCFFRKKSPKLSEFDFLILVNFLVVWSVDFD